MKFEWDENKNAKDKAKHSTDFNDALTIFDDDDRLETVDTRNNYGEERAQVIGGTKPGVLTVAYAWRHNETIRRIFLLKPLTLKSARFTTA